MDKLKTVLEAKKKMAQMMGGGMYNQNGIKSVGGHMGPVGGTVGMDHGKPFGSVNVKGKVVGSFGPQGNDAKPKPKKGKEVNPFMKA